MMKISNILPNHLLGQARCYFSNFLDFYGTAADVDDDVMMTQVLFHCRWSNSMNVLDSQLKDLVNRGIWVNKCAYALFAGYVQVERMISTTKQCIELVVNQRKLIKDMTCKEFKVFHDFIKPAILIVEWLIEDMFIVIKSSIPSLCYSSECKDVCLFFSHYATVLGVQVTEKSSCGIVKKYNDAPCVAVETMDTDANIEFILNLCEWWTPHWSIIAPHMKPVFIVLLQWRMSHLRNRSSASTGWQISMLIKQAMWCLFGNGVGSIANITQMARIEKEIRRKSWSPNIQPTPNDLVRLTETCDKLRARINQASLSYLDTCVMLMKSPVYFAYVDYFLTWWNNVCDKTGHVDVAYSLQTCWDTTTLFEGKRKGCD